MNNDDSYINVKDGKCTTFVGNDAARKAVTISLARMNHCDLDLLK